MGLDRVDGHVHEDSDLLVLAALAVAQLEADAHFLGEILDCPAEALLLLPLEHLVQCLGRLGRRLERRRLALLPLASGIERNLLALALARRAPAQLVLGNVVGDFKDPGLELRLETELWKT